jgi:hypothetical protein
MCLFKYTNTTFCKTMWYIAWGWAKSYGFCSNNHLASWQSVCSNSCVDMKSVGCYPAALTLSVQLFLSLICSCDQWAGSIQWVSTECWWGPVLNNPCFLLRITLGQNLINNISVNLSTVSRSTITKQTTCANVVKKWHGIWSAANRR